MRAPRRRALFAFTALVGVVAMLVARHGTARTRLLAACLLAGGIVLLFVVRTVERRVWRDPRRVIRRLAGRVDAARAARALRALSLVEHEDSGTSRELARLHVARTLAALPREPILEGAARVAYLLALASIACSLGTLAVAVTQGWGVVEGADVLLAHGGSAPFEVHWLDDPDLTGRPPDYLHEDERQWVPYARVAVPRGTLLTMRGAPLHSGRRLALTDGVSEVPFVDDGSGRLVARWPVGDSVRLRVVARFGDVLVREPLGTEVESIADEAPVVSLEGAPRRVLLAAEDTGDISIKYEVTDDHGLREVHLVLRSGPREERRVLAHLDGETRFDRGGHVLRATDPFFKKSHAPIEVRVEAKDNDPITGPKWGASDSIVVVPPDVGEPEARRMAALRKLRDAVVDSLAFRLGHDVPAVAKDRQAHVTEEQGGVDADQQLFEATLSTSYAGLRVPARIQAMLRGHLRRVREAMAHEAAHASAVTHKALVKATERLVLVVDAVVRGLGQRDSRDSAKQLADVADDLALGASQMQRAADRDRGAQRADAAVTVLDGGAGSLKQLGALGRDLGEIVTADLARVTRARTQDDLVHGEIAARDLAARLREPDPSFGAQGKGGRAGGEAGGGRGTPGEEGEGADDAEQAFDMAAQELEHLAQDHAEELGKVEQALSGALSEEEMKQLNEEAKKHARAVRDATKDLPGVGAGSDSWTNKGAAAREHGEAMARSLEQGNPSDAVTAGHSALDALDEARRTARRERWSAFGPLDDLDARDADRRLNDARQKLEPEVKWAEDKLAEMRRRAAERKSGELASDGEEEGRLADRARDLHDRGRDQQALPDPALQALEGAERAAQEAAGLLRRGDADRALEQQREAQHELEIARDALGSDSPEADRSEGGEREPQNGHADIPKADAYKGPEQFRRRVIHGLGQAASIRQKDAVRRYADGLLR